MLCSVRVFVPENLHRTVENIGVTEVLGSCYKIHSDGVEIRTSAA